MWNKNRAPLLKEACLNLAGGDKSYFVPRLSKSPPPIYYNNILIIEALAAQFTFYQTLKNTKSLKWYKSKWRTIFKLYIFETTFNSKMWVTC